MNIDNIFIFNFYRAGIFIISFIISAIAKSECDTIKFTPHKAWFLTDYWLGKKDVSKRPWLYKYPLSFMWDGWHLMDSTRNVCLIIISLIWFSISWYWYVLLVIAGYILYGLVFELFYQN